MFDQSVIIINICQQDMGVNGLRLLCKNQRYRYIRKKASMLNSTQSYYYILIISVFFRKYIPFTRYIIVDCLCLLLVHVHVYV